LHAAKNLRAPCCQWLPQAGRAAAQRRWAAAAAQTMLERDIQGTLRAWQAHLAAAALIFVQARAPAASLPLLETEQ